VLDWSDLPENERDEFARAIAARASWWSKSAAERAAHERARYLRFIGKVTAPVGPDDAGPENEDDEDWPAT
jgi:hypothetical protein